MSEPLRLRPPRHRVSPRAIIWWSTQAAGEVAAVLVPLVIGILAWADARPWLIPGTVAVAIIGLGYLLVMPRWRFRVHRWETTDDAVYTSAGWISQHGAAVMVEHQGVDSTGYGFGGSHRELDAAGLLERHDGDFA